MLHGPSRPVQVRLPAWRGEQLFDLETDPDEWHDLASDPRHRAVGAELRAAIQARFDPDAIEREVRGSLADRLVIKEAMERNRTSWDFSPDFDASRDTIAQYPPSDPDM